MLFILAQKLAFFPGLHCLPMCSHPAFAYWSIDHTGTVVAWEQGYSKARKLVFRVILHVLFLRICHVYVMY